MGINRFYNTILFVLVFISSFIFISFKNIDNTIKYSIKEYTKVSNITTKYSGKVVKENSNTYLVLPYQTDYNIPYIIKGGIPNDKNVTILPSFALKNNIKINDSISIYKKKYKVVGYSFNPLYIYPVITTDMPMFLPKYNNIIYMDNVEFNKISGLSVDHSLDDLRQNYINNKLESYSLYSSIIITFILTSVIALTFVIIKERLKYEEQNIFILKSLGYRNTYIAFKYLYKYLITMLISITLSFVLSYFLKKVLINILFSGFNIPIYKYNIYDLRFYLIYFIIIIINYVYLYIKLIKNNTIKNNMFIKLISKISIKNKYSLALSNTKLVVVFILNLIVTIFLIIILNFISYLNNIYTDSFKDINYKYMIKYNTFVKEDFSDYNVLFYNNKYYKKRDSICNKLNMPLSFNIKYSNNDLYSTTNIPNIEHIDSIININDLKENMKLEIKNNDIIFYIIIAVLITNFSFIMLTTFKIVIDNNKKNIYLLKILGYKNIIYNLFTPYLFSIVLSFIISALISNKLLLQLNIKILTINYFYSFFIVLVLYILFLVFINNTRIIKLGYKK